MKLSVAALKKEYNDYRLIHGDTEGESLFAPPEILSKPIEECGFSRRVISVLNWDKVYDVNGLVTKFFCLDDILKLRNIGRGYLHEIKIFMENHGLLFIRPGESTSQYYRRLNLSLAMNDSGIKLD